MAHLAAACAVPTLALFGPTNPRLTGPLGPRVEVLRHGCPYRPQQRQLHCHDQPGYPCPPSCWSSLTVERALGAVDELLAR